MLLKVLGVVALLSSAVLADEELYGRYRSSTSNIQPPEPGQRNLDRDRPIYAPEGPSTDRVTPGRSHHHNNNPPEPGHRNLGGSGHGHGHGHNRGNDGPPEPGHRNLGTSFVAGDDNEPSRHLQRRHYQPPEPGHRNYDQRDQIIVVPDGVRTDVVTPIRRDYDNDRRTIIVPDGPRTDGVLPIRRDYDNDRRTIIVPDGPRTDGVTPITRDYHNGRKTVIIPDGPSTDGLTPIRRDYDNDRRPIIVPDGPRTDGLTPIRRDYDNVPGGPRTDGLTPVLRENNYGQPLNNYAPSGPSTGPVISQPIEPGQSEFRRQDGRDAPGGPRTDYITPPRRNRDYELDEPIEPNRGRFTPETNRIVDPPIGPGQNRFQPSDIDQQYEWRCDMRTTTCRLENRANFVPFNKDYFLDTPVLLLDIDEAARVRHSVARLNPVKTYNGARLVTKEFFPPRKQTACLHFSFLWTGYVEKRMHILQRNRDDRCIYSEHQLENGPIPDSWKDIELQLDLSGGESSFLIEFAFETPYSANNIYNGLGKIAIRNFTINYGYCRNNRAFECDLPV